jgi:S-formylglutathione hydrolase FrmB
VELVKYMDAHYRTIPRREGRALAGNSMGGHGAMFLAIRHKDTFSAVASMSGCADIRGSAPQVGAFANNWGLRHVLGDIKKFPARWNELTVINQVDSLKPGDLAIFIACGTSDFFLKVNRQLHEKLAAKKIAHDYTESPGNHSWNYWKGTLPRQMLFLDKHFKRAQQSDRRP